MTPGVSFVPVYNKPHLPSVLRQISRQTGEFPRQFVFVDDDWTDGSLEIVRELTADWENTVIHHQQNEGSAGATNACIELANQPFIKFVDADDLIADGATETLLRAIGETDACLAFGAATYLPKRLTSNSPRRSTTRKPNCLRTSAVGDEELALQSDSVSCPHGKLLKKPAAVMNGSCIRKNIR